MTTPMPLPSKVTELTDNTKGFNDCSSQATDEKALVAQWLVKLPLQAPLCHEFEPASDILGPWGPESLRSSFCGWTVYLYTKTKLQTLRI
ncbi:hypothetical protein PoB_002398400 [Plakobranchus ocellatus]|uniref:Uncharacterized protein n=1 Tax=Plakobranchus ocellatus TaxID=259542 RepID=A0AAV3ZU92_9GAST|nr:hypothetical protein PoB_002398400 [Plakobranchus ocellatus]